jgi:hypothetical protein
VGSLIRGNARECSQGGREDTASMVDERLNQSRAAISNLCGCRRSKIAR